jgi:chemosensory pili system protein ChpA (sensor histidine kinase/response regulator)
MSTDFNIDPPPGEQALQTADGPEDEIIPDLLEVFLEEGRDLLPQIGESLHKLQKSPDDHALIQYLLRPLHTIKGSARMAGAMRLGQHMHDLESRIGEMVRDGLSSAVLIDELLAHYDHGLHLFEALQASPLSTTSEITPAIYPDAPMSKPLPASTGEAIAPDDAGTVRSAALPPLVRIHARVLDNLLNQVGEITISHSGLTSEVKLLRQYLDELDSNAVRFGAQLREVQIQAETRMTAPDQQQRRHADPPETDRSTHLQELAGMLAEGVNDVFSLQKNLLEVAEHAQNGLAQQARCIRKMQRELIQARMVQFRRVEERLHRLVRQMARETGKKLVLEINGNTVELERSILEKMVGPLEHLLRNAAVHGIEQADQRRAAGKEIPGRLTLEVRQEGQQIMIRLSDDGQGLNLARIHEKAVHLGLVGADQRLSNAELSSLIFQPGFSTSTDVTMIAGRGVGMNAVSNDVASLNGRISIDTVSGKGVSFTIHLPLSLVVMQVVLLELGGQIYGIPSLLVEQMVQMQVDERARMFHDGSMDWQGSKLPMYYLSALLGEDKGVPLQQTLPILVIKRGHDFIALLVDRIIGSREVVTRNIGPQLTHMHGVVGATILDNGNIVLILNPVQLAQHHSHQKILRWEDTPVSGSGAAQKTVLVVDDSLTVRHVMQRLLTREGYHVVFATDGINALHQLRNAHPDIALVDIEMPRMNGFDLTRHIRSMESTAVLPIIMITSRTAARYRERAMELGVNAYLGKPCQDEVLLQCIHDLIGKDS